MNKIFLLLPLFLLASCTTPDKLAKKNISCNASIIDSHIGIDRTGCPELKTVFISGDYSSVQAEANTVIFREESAASIWNAESVTRKKFLFIATKKADDMAEILQKLTEALKEKQ